MNSIAIRFYGSLNEFLPNDKKQITFMHFFNEQPSIKDIIESIGIPHTEIDLLLIDGQSVDFSQKLYGGERVAVYPVFQNIDISGITKVRPEPLARFRFIVDVHLGKLASYLRMAGFDSIYSNHASHHQLVYCSSSEQRILLTFNSELLKRKNVIYGYCVRSRNPVSQLVEVLERFELQDLMQPFTRCMCCNAALLAVSKEAVLNSLPEKVRESLDEFWLCQGCGHVYWKGTHFKKMCDFIDRLNVCSQLKTQPMHWHI